MRGCFAAIGLALGSAAQAEPPGWQVCRDTGEIPGALDACYQTATVPCRAKRGAEGDGAWLGCLSDTAAAWEDEVGRLTQRLQAAGNPAGDAASAARWLAMRTARCRPSDKVMAMMQARGEAETAAAILRCETLNSIQRANGLADAASQALLPGD